MCFAGLFFAVMFTSGQDCFEQGEGEVKGGSGLSCFLYLLVNISQIQKLHTSHANMRHSSSCEAQPPTQKNSKLSEILPFWSSKAKLNSFLYSHAEMYCLLVRDLSTA